jgi:hypothetical protein
MVTLATSQIVVPTSWLFELPLDQVKGIPLRDMAGNHAMIPWVASEGSVFSFSYFLFQFSQSGNQPQRGFSQSGDKANREGKKLGMLGNH